jgi:hypothetical protein
MQPFIIAIVSSHIISSDYNNFWRFSDNQLSNKFNLKDHRALYYYDQFINIYMIFEVHETSLNDQIAKITNTHT